MMLNSPVLQPYEPAFHPFIFKHRWGNFRNKLDVNIVYM